MDRLSCFAVLETNLGSFAFSWMPNNFLNIFLNNLALLKIFTIDETIVLENIWPNLSVEVRILSLKEILFFEFLIALPLYIKCGKSISHSCGGTYGHLVIKHKSHK